MKGILNRANMFVSMGGLDRYVLRVRLGLENVRPLAISANNIVPSIFLSSASIRMNERIGAFLQIWHKRWEEGRLYKILTKNQESKSVNF